MYLVIASTIVAVFMATTMIFVRLKAAQKPTSAKKIILPPIFMSTGALMFLFPEFRVPWMQVFEAIGVGMIFSIVLIRSSKFKIRKSEVYMIPSRSFVIILFGLLIIRIIAKLIIGSHISFGETSGMFYLLAFGMIITWRLAMLYKYNKLKKRIKTVHH